MLEKGKLSTPENISTYQEGKDYSSSDATKG